MNNEKLALHAISKIRIDTDGNGIRSLIGVSGCPLYCKYCLNEVHSKVREAYINLVTEEELYDKIKLYILYYDISNGGITFGGGEPLQYYQFICNFYEKYHIDTVIETSLNVDIPSDTLEYIAQQMKLIVDIKDINEDIYKKYTNRDNKKVLKNLKVISKYNNRVIIRIPSINGYNTKENIEKSIKYVRELGFNNLDIFEYNTILKCKNCGHRIDKSINFCPKCGTKVNNQMN